MDTRVREFGVIVSASMHDSVLQRYCCISPEYAQVADIVMVKDAVAKKHDVPKEEQDPLRLHRHKSGGDLTASRKAQQKEREGMFNMTFSLILVGMFNMMCVCL